MGEAKDLGVKSNDKIKLLKMFMFIFCLIFILLLTYLVGTLAMLGRDAANQVNQPNQSDRSDENDPDIYFGGCELVEAECLDIVICGLKVYCGDKNYAECRIYDCGDSYGIFTREIESGVFEFKNTPKPDIGNILEKKDQCVGTLEVLSEKCVEGKTEIEVRIATKGECEIESFNLKYEGTGMEKGTFAISEEGIYIISAKGCGEVNKIVPIGKGGIILDF